MKCHVVFSAENKIKVIPCDVHYGKCPKSF